VVEKCAGNISVKSHVYGLNIRRQKHEMLIVGDMVVLFINLKTSDGSEGPCCITSIELKIPKKLFYLIGIYTHNFVALFINPELLLHDNFKVCLINGDLS
jgi:hypothetical protein